MWGYGGNASTARPMASKLQKVSWRRNYAIGVLDLTTDTTAWPVCELSSVFHNGVIGIFSHEEYPECRTDWRMELLAHLVMG